MNMEAVAKHAESIGVSIQLEEIPSEDILRATLALPNDILRYRTFKRTDNEKVIKDWIDADAKKFWGGKPSKKDHMESTIIPVDSGEIDKPGAKKEGPANESAPKAGTKSEAK
jgi:hypothetical protein